MADGITCHHNGPVPVTVKNCQHHIKVKEKYSILHGWKKCAVCTKRWCGAKCKCCGKPVHRQCTNDQHDVSISSEVTKIIEDVVNAYMNDYYDEKKKIINLSDFSADERFRHCDLVVSLNQPQALYTALHVVKHRVGNDLYGLNLAKNMINSGDGIVKIAEFFPDLKALDLSNNELTDLTTLECLSGFALEYLYLKGNPVDATCARTPFTLEVQKIFPWLLYLDHVELEPLEKHHVPPPAVCHTKYNYSANLNKKRKFEEIEDVL